MKWHTEGCAVCGSTGQYIIDHCHVTGLVRGRLCKPCNLREGNGAGAVWPYWRALAPELATRQMYLPGAHSPHLTEAEVLSEMTIADLFRLDACRQLAADGVAVCASVYDTAIGEVVHPLRVAS